MHTRGGGVIELSLVSKRFGNRQSLDQLSLRVERGDVFGLLGPNGAGKTTTLRAILGLVRPDEGQISVLGHNPGTEGQQVRAQVGVLLESDGLYGRLTASCNLDFHARIHHMLASVRESRIRELLQSMDLWERRNDRVAIWSKGMRQRLALCRALLHRPPLLLLDEPFAGLDPTGAAELRLLIATLARERQVTILLSAHDLAHVEKACNRVAVIRGGRVIAEGAPRALSAESPADDVEVAVKGSGLSESVLRDMERERIIVSYEAGETTAKITCPRKGRERLGPELVRRGVVIEELHTIEKSLEDSFLSLMASQGSPS
jgi:ABC-2 type transport system ATP-binding protein